MLLIYSSRADLNGHLILQPTTLKHMTNASMQPRAWKQEFRLSPGCGVACLQTVAPAA
ncbi:Hypothetical predicted protein [Lynx pardinus]|uniref:Uncharacterized protein n=1 Tax=Lynx pardinus TaxID=191816 RepID=A0A485N940_LYNPA|nr:Hypothetical predicted protein [Lynx pardinus]